MPTKTARSNSWKKIQSRQKIKQKTKLALIVLFFLLLILLFGQLVRFTKTLFSPWQQSVQKNYLWDGEFNINLVVKSRSVSVISYNSQDKKIVILKIPDETYLEVPRSFGRWQLRSVYDLGGGQLLKETITNFLGLPIDGFLILEGQIEAEELVEILRKNPLSGVNLLPDLKTDLTLWEVIRLKTGFSSVRFDKISQLDLEKLGILDEQKLLDGSQVLVGENAKIDTIISILADPQIQSERKTIAVFNSTNHPQLAQKAARLLSNLGANVIITSNAQSVDKTGVFGSKSKTLERLNQIFNTDGKISTSDEIISSSRAQINVVLGEDYFKQ